MTVTRATATAIALVLAAPALAQTAPSAQPAPADNPAPSNIAATSPGLPSAQGNDQDIVVTARRIAENLQDVPLAVSAVSGASLQRQAIREVKDLSATVPNLAIYTSNSGGSAIVIGIRGQLQSTSSLLYTDPSVGLYVDGLANPRNNGLRSGLVDIQRIEVLRGPQGTLYGKNTTGGAVSIITQDPKKDFGGSLQASYGNYNAYNLMGILNVPLGDDFGLRLVANYGKHDPFGHEVATGRGLGQESSGYYRAKLKFESGPLKITLLGDYFRYRASGIDQHLSGITPASLDPKINGRVCAPFGDPSSATAACATGYYAVAGGLAAAYFQRSLGLPFTAAGLNQASAVLASYVRHPGDGYGFYDNLGTNTDEYGFPITDNVSTSTGGSVSLNVDYTLSDQITLRSISGWRAYNRVDHYDLDSTPFALLETDNTTPFANFYSEEAQVLGNMGRLTWVLGGYFSYERGLDYTPSVSLQAVGATNYGLADGLTRNISRAIFGQASYKITDALTFTAGARYTSETRKLRNRNVSIGSLQANGTRTVTCAVPTVLLDNPAVCEANFSKTFTDPSFLASLDYKFTRDILAYVKFSRGFRSGGQQGRANTPTVVDTFTPFRPETVTEYEGGVKSELFDRHLRLNLAVYYDNYNDVQRNVNLLSSTGASYSIFSNAAKARLYGFEGEANLRVTPQLSFNGSFGYLNAKYKEFLDVSLGDRTGEPWPAPKWNYALGSTYTAPVGFGTVAADLSWNYRSSVDFNPQSQQRSQATQPGYGLLNGRLSVYLAAEGVEVAVFGRNILAKHYYTSGVGLESLGINVLNVGDPRSFGIQLTKKFGSER